jgi:MinD superfamily P-loop ATPase
MSHAQLNIAEEASGKLVALVRENAQNLAKKYGKDLIIIDGPPGIGCPVIASLTGVNVALIVTEPTFSGIHDMERILDVAKHFGIKSLVCINKYDVNKENSRKIEKYCEDNSVELIGKISFDPIVTRAMVAGKSVVEFSNGKVSKEIEKMWEKVKEYL